MRGTAGGDTTNPCLSRRLCQQKAISHHDLDAEGIHFLLRTGLSIGTVHPRDAASIKICRQSHDFFFLLLEKIL